jgi:hypothetical protein
MVADRRIGREAGVDGLVAAVHRDVVDVDVDEEVALCDAATHADLLAALRLPNRGVVLLVFCVVVVQMVGVEAADYLLSEAVCDLRLRHPAVQPQSRDEVDVLYTLRVRLLDHLLYDELAVVRGPHRGKRDREVVEGDGELHAGTQEFVQRLHPHRFEQRPLDGDAGVGERLEGPWRIDHACTLRQLLVVEPVPRVEHHRGAVFIEDGDKARTAQFFAPFGRLKHFSTLPSAACQHAASRLFSTLRPCGLAFSISAKGARFAAPRHSAELSSRGPLPKRDPARGERQRKLRC